jgi:hypothetical protein
MNHHSFAYWLGAGSDRFLHSVYFNEAEPAGGKERFPLS